MPVTMNFCRRDIFIRQVMGSGRHRTSMSSSMMTIPFQRKKLTSLIQLPDWSLFQKYETGSQPASMGPFYNQIRLSTNGPITTTI